MEANNHTAPEEAARAQHIVSSMSRYRRKNGAALGRLIGSMKQMAQLPPGIGIACMLPPAVEALLALELSSFAVAWRPDEKSLPKDRAF
jgi:hypothetical protein